MMNARNRTRRGVLAVGAVCVLVLLATAASAIASAIYCGGGRGPTAEVAIQEAIFDAQNSAQGDGLFSCTLVGEPLVALIKNDPWRGDFYRASVNMSCR